VIRSARFRVEDHPGQGTFDQACIKGPGNGRDRPSLPTTLFNDVAFFSGRPAQPARESARPTATASFTDSSTLKPAQRRVGYRTVTLHRVRTTRAARTPGSTTRSGPALTITDARSQLLARTGSRLRFLEHGRGTYLLARRRTSGDNQHLDSKEHPAPAPKSETRDPKGLNPDTVSRRCPDRYPLGARNLFLCRKNHRSDRHRDRGWCEVRPQSGGTVHLIRCSRTRQCTQSRSLFRVETESR